MATVRVRVRGAKKMAEALRSFPRLSLVRSTLRRAGTEALQPVVDRAQALAPKDRPQLAPSIRVYTVRAPRGRGGDNLTLGVGPTEENFHGMFHEFGTRKMRATPFLGPAWDAALGSMIPRYAESMWTVIERTAKRVRVRG